MPQILAPEAKLARSIPVGIRKIHEFPAANGVHLMAWLFAPFAILLGVVLTTQVATNAQLGKALGNLYIPACG